MKSRWLIPSGWWFFLNRFLRHNRILTIHREFVHDAENSYWSLAVEYLSGKNQTTEQPRGRSGKNRVDYKEVLSPEDFGLFARLREWRKEKAGEAGMPVYTIFTNEQLAQIAVQRILSKTGMREIEGIGESRIKKYDDAVIQLILWFSQCEFHAIALAVPPPVSQVLSHARYFY